MRVSPLAAQKEAGERKVAEEEEEEHQEDDRSSGCSNPTRPGTLYLHVVDRDSPTFACTELEKPIHIRVAKIVLSKSSQQAE